MPALILTLALEPGAQAYFDRLRTQHFPPERNVLDAHITLFHQLPPELVPTLPHAADRAPFPVQVTGLRSLGSGVAFTLQSAPLAALRTHLAALAPDALTPQDRQRYRPHITIQNKTSPAAARILLTTLTAAFSPFEITATGLLLWTYLGGPWELRARYDFTAC